MYRFGRIVFSLFFIIYSYPCFAQKTWVADSLSVLNERIRVARLSNNNREVLQSYFGNGLAANLSWASPEDFQKVVVFLQAGVDFARSINNHDYTAIGYTRLANLLRKHNDLDKALQNALLASNDAYNIESDSVKAISFIELGDCYQKKTKTVEACKSFNTAFYLALKAENYFLESKISHRLANLYYSAGDTSEAKRQIYKSVVINKQIKFGEGLIEDYIALGRVTDNDKYIDTVFTLADSMGLESKTFPAKTIRLAIYGFVHKDPQKAIAYINSNKDVKENIMKKGMAHYHWYLGQLFRYGNMPDSGIYYFKLAEPEIFKDLGVSFAKNIYLHMAVCYQLKHDWRNAIFFYEKMLGYSKQFGERLNIITVSDSLSLLYYQTGQYKKAFELNLLSKKVKDTVAVFGKEKELVLLDLDRETKRHEEDLRLEKERLHKKHNLQYMGITIAICVVFFFFFVLGMFPVSKVAIRIFGFISFICLFEFIILLIEHSVLHPITHGDPLKLWLLKIVLIAMLVPFQQLIEHKLIHFLQSRKLHHARTKLLQKKWGRKKKPFIRLL